MPYIVPQPSPAPPTGFGQFANALGGDIDKVKDLLLAAVLSGQLARVPQQTVAPTGNIQNLALPGGQQFSGTPQAAQRLIPDYIRNLQSQVNTGQLPTGGLPTGFGATPTGQSRMRFLPSLTRPVQQAQLREAEASATLKERQAKQDPQAILKALGIDGAPSPTGMGSTVAGQTSTSGFGLTGLDVDPATGAVNLKLGETPEAKSAREVRTKQETDLATRRRETQEGFRRTMGLFSNLTAQFKSKLQAQGGEGGVGAGLAGWVSSRFRAPGTAPIEAFEGQRKETALGLNNIITGQNRVIKGVVEMLEDTLPDRLDTAEFAEQKLSQSIANSFRLLVANNRGILTEDILHGFDNPKAGRTLVEEFVDRIELLPEEEAALQQLIEQVLSTPAAPSGSILQRPAATKGFRVIRQLP